MNYWNMINGFETDLDRVFALSDMSTFSNKKQSDVLMKEDSIVLIRDGNQKTIVSTLLWRNTIYKWVNIAVKISCPNIQINEIRKFSLNKKTSNDFCTWFIKLFYKIIKLNIHSTILQWYFRNFQILDLKIWIFKTTNYFLFI